MNTHKETGELQDWALKKCVTHPAEFYERKDLVINLLRTCQTRRLHFLVFRILKLTLGWPNGGQNRIVCSDGFEHNTEKAKRRLIWWDACSHLWWFQFWHFIRKSGYSCVEWTAPSQITEKTWIKYQKVIWYSSSTWLTSSASSKQAAFLSRMTSWSAFRWDVYKQLIHPWN